MKHAHPLNLLPRTLVAKRSQRRCICAWASVGILYAAAILSAGVATRNVGGAEQGQLRSQLTELSSASVTLAHEVQEMRMELAAAPGKLELAKALSDSPDWSILLRALAQVRGSDLTMSEINIEPRSPRAGAGDATLVRIGSFRVLINGRALSQQEVTTFTLRLQDLGCFSSVLLVRSGRDQSEPAGIDFQLECVLGDTGGKR